MLDLQTTFSTKKLIGLGESSHGNHVPALQFLHPYLSGFTGLFLELPHELQDAADNFFETGEVDRGFGAFREGSSLEGNDMTQTDNYLRILKKEFNWHIIAMDSQKVPSGEFCHLSNVGYWYLRGSSRDEDMATIVNQTIESLGGRWLILAGGAHIRYGEGKETNLPSLGSLLKEKYSSDYCAISLQALPSVEDILVEEPGKRTEFDLFIVHS